MAFNKFGQGICPDDCDDRVFYPALETDQECTDTASVTVKSQICDLWIRPDEATTFPTSFSTGDMATYLTAEVDNTNLDNTKIKHLTGEGGIPAAELTEVDLPKDKTVVSKRTYTLTFTRKNLSDLTYNFLRRIQCGATGFVFWYATVGGYLFGSTNGVSPASVNVDFVYGEGKDDVQQANITVTFEAKIDPERIANPFA